MPVPQQVLLRREQTFAVIFSALLAWSLAHFGHTDLEVLSIFQHLVGAPAEFHTSLRHAPDAYRVAMPALIAGISRLLPTTDNLAVQEGLNFLLLWVGLILLYAVTVADLPAEEARSRRLLQISLTYLFATVALTWITQYQRPETAPTALYLILGALCLRSPRAWSWLLPLTAVQGLVRADAPFCFGLGIAVAGLTGLRRVPGEARRLIVLGLATALVAGLAQAYLQFVRFPHLSYDPQTPVIQLGHNLQFHSLQSGLLAVLPVTLALVYGSAKGQLLLLSLPERAALSATMLYFPLWFTVGSLAEPRIFVPYLLLLSPLAARAVANSLAGEIPAGLPS